MLYDRIMGIEKGDNMICKNCGEKVKETFEYCPFCGDFLDKSTYLEREEQSYEVSPTCHFLISMIPDMKMILILMLYTVIHVYFKEELLLTGYYQEEMIWYVYLIVFAWYLGKAVWKKIKCRKTSYIFYKDHMEYHEDFGRKIVHRVNYDTIGQVSLYQSWLDSLLDQGTLALYPATRDAYGIYIHDMKHVKEVYHRVKEIVEA